MSGRQRRAKDRKRLRRAAALSGTVALSLAAPAAAADFSASPFDDVNPLEAGSGPSRVTPVGGGIAFFAADDGVSGRELWRTDGTAGGTTLVRDIVPGGDSSAPENLVNVGGTLFFTANTEATGSELWKSDGTEGGTVLVKEIRPGTYSSNAAGLVNLGGTLIFTATDDASGTELWRSDGTTGGTTLVKDVDPAGSSAPAELTVVGSTLFFAAADAAGGRELYKSGGTSANTVLVEDIRPGGSSSNPHGLTNVSGTLAFAADDGSSGQELWKSDGTAVGTALVEDINPAGASSAPAGLTNVDGTLAFAANDGTAGTELWRSDGTAATTTLVKDVRSGSGNGAIDKYPQPRLLALGSTLYFAGTTTAEGTELWKSNLTEAGTELVRDIRPGGDSGLHTSKYGSVTPLSEAGGALFFHANDGTTGVELWRSDGTEAGTTLVRDIRGGPAPSTNGGKYPSVVDLGGTVLFAANDGSTGTELWRTDGTAGGTTQIRNLNTATEYSFKYGRRVAAEVGGTVFFVATDGSTGSELFKADVATGAASLVKDIFPGERRPGTSASSDPQEFTNVGGTLFFTAADATGGEELWKSDGTAEGTVQVKDIAPGLSSGDPYLLVNVGGTLFFTARDADQTLWKSDGTEAGTVQVKDIDGASATNSIRGLTNVDGTLYFAADDGSSGQELWKSDGTSGGTVQVKDINPGGAAGRPRNMVAVGGAVLFTATDASGDELWRTDGTEGGTVRVKDIRSGPDSGVTSGYYGDSLAAVGDTLFFSANDGSSGLSLWKSDGTADGTVPVKTISAASSGTPSSLTNVGGTLFFTAGDAGTGRELWKSDGTPAGTTLVSDIRGGDRGSYPGSLTNVGGTLLFPANDGSTGTELWQSDGTGAGTKIVRDIRPGTAGGNPANFVTVGSSLFFSADDGRRGSEPWRAAVPPPAPTPTPTPTPGVSPAPTVTAPIVKRKPRLKVTVKPRRDRRKPYRYKLKGTLRLPSGIRKADGCSGRVRVVARKKKVRKSLFAKTVRVNKRCTFRVKRAKLNRRAGRRGKATFTFTYRGNKVLTRASKKARVRFGKRR